MRKIFKSLYPNQYSSRLITREDIRFTKEYAEKLNTILEEVINTYDCVEEFPKFNSKEERIAYYSEKLGYNLRPNNRCQSLDKIPFIFPDGTLANCLYNSLGNVLETPIPELWQNEIAEKTREYINKNGNFPTCGRCTCFYKD